MITLILFLAYVGAVALFLAILHRLSPERDRQDRNAPTPQKEAT